MKSDPANIYEAGQGNLGEETERLASFDLPTKISTQAIGAIRPDVRMLDIGAGPNTQLGQYVRSNSGHYTALDKNADFLEQQKIAGAQTAIGDIRELPFKDASFDICHARFVISHLGQDKQRSIKEVLRVTKPKGRAIFIEYDWTTAHGSRNFDELKDFMIRGEFLFDAAYGAELEADVRAAAADGTWLTVSHHAPTRMNDYSQVLKLREAGTNDLKLQGKYQAAATWNGLLDRLQTEANATNPPGYFFPGITAVVAARQ